MGMDYYKIPTYTAEGTLQAVIEIPAGTNKKLEYDPEKKGFFISLRNGEKRVIDFLPYPVNYGFIPSTYSDPERGGDGDALDIIILSESESTGTVMEVIPIGVIKLIDDKESDYKIVAIPFDRSKQIIKAKNYNDLVTYYPQVKDILQQWFQYYDKEDPTSIEGWGDEKEAQSEIEKWLI